MSVNLLYSVNDSHFSMPLRDYALFRRLAERYPQEAELVFGLDESDARELDGAHATVSRKELLYAVKRLLLALKEDATLRPVRYVFDFDIIPGIHVTGHEEVFLVHLPGIGGQYHLVGGIGRCELREFEVGANGLRVYRQSLDVSERSEVETTSHGLIRIRTTKGRSLIANDLDRLRRFLESQSGESVFKQVE